nr:protein kinase 4-like [Dermatophagoides farinae]
MTINSTTTDCTNEVGVHVHNNDNHNHHQSIVLVTTNNDDNDDEDVDSGLNQDIDHHHNHNGDINKIKKKRCSSPTPTPTPPSPPSILNTLIDGKHQHYSDNSVCSSRSSSSNFSDKCHLHRSTSLHQQQSSTVIHQREAKTCSQKPQILPPPPPPRTVPRRSRQQQQPKPVDVNNNKSTAISSLNNHRHQIKLKEKITRIDMAPAPDEQNQILPPVENCDHHDLLSKDDSKKSKKKKMINQDDQSIDWRLKLAEELDLYQQILIQRQQSSHSAETPSSSRQHRNGKSSANHHHHHHCNGHHPHHAHYHHHHHHHHQHIANSQNKLKSLKFLKHKSNNSDTVDSLGDSWEETTTTSTTSDHGNNINTPTLTTTTTTVESDSNERKCKIFTRGSKSASSDKSTSSSSNHHAKNCSISADKNPASGKRRSASFNKQQNVRIVTPYERILQALEVDKTWQKEIAFGRRIGLYRFRGDIGNGNFSRVKIAIHSLTKEKVAVKILDKSRLDMKTQKMLSREIRTMETLHHPNLIRIFEVIESFSKHFLVMELAPGGELFQVISTNGRFSESEAKYFFSQIISAIDHMHQHNLIHRDIKAENVFFSDPATVKVGDFGFSTRIASKDELLSTFCGSPPYAAPELFRDESYRGPYVDYWALGVLLYFIVTGLMPFRAQNIVSLKKLILDCRYDIPNYVSVECCQLIAAFLQPDPLKRYTLEQARNTRWLHNQPHQRSLPKYDLKNSYAKLIKHRNSGKLSSSSSPPPTTTTTESVDNRQYPPLNDDEKETFHQLMLLGIDEQVLSDHIDKGSHSHIVGTFRILMHRVLRQSMERQRKQSSHHNDLDDTNSMSPIRRTTSMNVAPLDRIWAHYARKAQLEKQRTHPSNQKSGQPLKPMVNGQCQPPFRSDKATNQVADKSKNPKLIKINQSSNDSRKSSGKSRLQKMFSTNSNDRASPPPPPPQPASISPPETAKSNDQPVKESVKIQKDPPKKQITSSKQTSESIAAPTPVEEIEIKKNEQQPIERCNGDNGGNNHATSRLTRSFRTLKQLLTENNICGNNTPVVHPQTINIGGLNKPHVIHKTTTLQIMARPNPTSTVTAPLLWQTNPKTRGKLWRSQTTPDVSLIDGTMCIGNHAHHHHHHHNPAIMAGGNHLTLPCYHCDNPHYALSSNKKSFINQTNRCTII